jgi:uncharacterized YigZ family protein
MPEHLHGAAPRLARYRVPTGEAQSELVAKNSAFIGTAGPAPTVEAAQAFIAAVRARYANANHNAWAYRLFDGGQALFGSSDDGEPGGTAGRPILAVLEGSGLNQVAAVVTRYFGGTLLGTGGLVRAYGGAAREALAVLPTRELALHAIAHLRVDYGLHGNLRYLLPRQGVLIEDEEFADQVTLHLAIPHEQVPELARLLRELSNGALNLDRCLAGERYL